jgi:hypothetical protein
MRFRGLITHLHDVWQGKTTWSVTRSDKWPEVRAAHLKLFPNCTVCGGTKNIQVHHMQPFHLHPELELDPTNLITLCEDPGHNCHLTFGHLDSFQSWNPNVVADSAQWNQKITARPTPNPAVPAAP